MGTDSGNFVVLNTAVIQASEEAAPARLGLLGNLIIEVYLRNIDITLEVGFDEFSRILPNDLAVGCIVGSVAACQPGGVTSQIHISNSNLDSFGSGIFQIRDGCILAQWGNGDPIDFLSNIGLDEFGFLGLIIVCV